MDFGSVHFSAAQALRFQSTNSERVQAFSSLIPPGVFTRERFFGWLHSQALVEAINRFFTPSHTHDHGWPASAVGTVEKIARLAAMMLSTNVRWRMAILIGAVFSRTKSD